MAKLSAPDPPSEEQSKLPTADSATQPGVVLGTVGYISPEQVRGRAAAPSLERVIRHCLEKNPQERFQSASDLAFDLEMISGASGTSAAQTVTIPTSPKGLRVAALILLVITSLAGAFFAGRQSSLKSDKKLSVLPESGYKRITFRRGFISAARFTPDGQSIVYSAAWVGNPEQLFVTRPQNPVSRSLGISNAALLSISNSGEMAILLDPEYRNGWERTGTLARAPIDG